MSELMIPSLTGSLTGTRLVMRAYSVMAELMSPSLTGTKISVVAYSRLFGEVGHIFCVLIKVF